MRKWMAVLAAMALLPGIAAARPADPRGQKEYDTLLRENIAGPATDCVMPSGISGTRVIAGKGIVYRVGTLR